MIYNYHGWNITHILQHYINEFKRVLLNKYPNLYYIEYIPKNFKNKSMAMQLQSFHHYYDDNLLKERLSEVNNNAVMTIERMMMYSKCNNMMCNSVHYHIEITDNGLKLLHYIDFYHIPDKLINI